MPATLLRVLPLLALAVAVPACAATDAGEASDADDEENLDDAIGDAVGELAVPGRWSPPRSVINEGAKARFAYENAGGSCSGGLLAGTRALGAAIQSRFPNDIAAPGGGLPAVQGYNCRNIRGGSGLSIHATGRALDVFIPRTGGKADNTKGDEVANWAVANAAELGVQAVIWDRGAWSVRTKSLHDYRGVHPHDDHVHIEITSAAAAKRLPWYRDR